jgi:uncharacterized protein YkwD
MWEMKKSIKTAQISFATGIAGALVSLGGGYYVGHYANAPHAQTTKVQQTQTKQPESSSSTQKPQIEYVNELRTKRGLKPLNEDQGLNNSAKAKADDIVAKGYYGHTAANGDPFYFLIYKNRPGLRQVGENLNKCMPTLELAFQTWEESPEHLKNIVNPNFTLYGSAMVWNPNDSCFIYVNHFGN